MPRINLPRQNIGTYPIGSSPLSEVLRRRRQNMLSMQQPYQQQDASGFSPAQGLDILNNFKSFGGGTSSGGSSSTPSSGFSSTPGATPAAIVIAALVARNQIEKSKYFRGKGPLGKLGEASRTMDPFTGFNILQAPKEALRRPAHYINETLNPLAHAKRIGKTIKGLFS